MPTYVQGDTVPLSEFNAKPRTNLLQQDAVRYNIPLSAAQYADGDPIDATGAAGDPKIVNGGWGDGNLHIEGQAADNNTKTETYMLEFSLPVEYVAGQTVSFFAIAEYDGAGTLTTKTVDIEVYGDDRDGTPSADLNATAAQTITTSVVQYDFTITPTTLNPGDLLRIYVRTVMVETGTNPATPKIYTHGLLLDIKG